jgi:hypothetical protein
MPMILAILMLSRESPSLPVMTIPFCFPQPVSRGPGVYIGITNPTPDLYDN